MQNLSGIIGRWAGLGAFLLLAACEEPQVILPGEREGIREVLGQDGGGALALAGAENQSVAVALPAAVANGSWRQDHGTPSGRTDHPALSAPLQLVWETGIGAGDGKRIRLDTTPVADAGRIFTLDAGAQVSAVSSGGGLLWSTDLTPLRDDAGEAFRGGLALGGGRLYVTSGFGFVAALDQASGDVLWEQRLGNTATGAPTFYDGVVYLTAGDRTAWAVEADTGRIRWQIDGVEDVVNVAGAPAPALTDTYAIFGFGSGDVQASFRKGGLRLWSATLAGRRDGVAVATITDITGGPVVVGETVYVGNHSGNTVALSIGSGDRLWTAPVGALDPVWAVGGSVFLVSDQNRLVRLDATTGAQVWEAELPGYVERRNPQRRRDRAYANHGPVVAGGLVWVASSDGKLRGFSPADGTLVTETAVPGGATTRPIVVDGTLYVVTTKGTLAAFR